MKMKALRSIMRVEHEKNCISNVIRLKKALHSSKKTIYYVAGQTLITGRQYCFTYTEVYCPTGNANQPLVSCLFGPVHVEIKNS